VLSRFVDMTADELDSGDVLVRTKYSTINYKDALSYNGAGKIMRKYPDQRRHRHGRHGRVVAGHAVEARRQGDRARVRHGRRARRRLFRIRPRSGDWVVRRPESMTAFDAMTLGTAGYTAAQAILAMEHNGLKPDNGPVAVTGATGGVGSVAVEILAKIGYHVVAITGKPEEARYLRALGAKEVLQRQAIEGLEHPPARQVDVGRRDRQPWRRPAGVAPVDVEDQRHRRGRRPRAGMKLNTTVAPFILRGVSLLGIDSANTPMSQRQKIWNKLAVEVAARPSARSGANHRFRRAARRTSIPS
jgi:NADPH:quinone reductase-like Zn-dependent oxidoreductase